VKWVVRVISAIGVLVVSWCALTAWPAIVHGHPLYGVLLLLTLLVAVVAGWWTFRGRAPWRGWRRVVAVILVVLALGWLALMAWLRPFTAVEPALAAMSSDSVVTVAESTSEIVMTPSGDVSPVGVFFQPGAKVEARAYAAVLRPLAEAGHTVVIAKQPLGIAFLSLGAFESARDANPQIASWVVGGHSLGGTVAAMEAEAHDSDAMAPVTGLMLYASYPASDMSTSLVSDVISISGTNDGLATPADIDASRGDLPAGAAFLPIDGAVHAFFGDYGPQPGDGTPTITHDAARDQISGASVDFAERLSAP
jgi:hypothetical protein